MYVSEEQAKTYGGQRLLVSLRLRLSLRLVSRESIVKDYVRLKLYTVKTGPLSGS